MAVRGRLSRGDAVVAVRTEPVDTGEFGQTARGAAAREHRNHVDGLGDQRLGNGNDSFLDELFETAKRAETLVAKFIVDDASQTGLVVKTK